MSFKKRLAKVLAAAYGDSNLTFAESSAVMMAFEHAQKELNMEEGEYLRLQFGEFFSSVILNSDKED